MMHGIKFGDKHSYKDFKLVPTSRPVFSPPEADIKKIQVPGRNGELDVSEALTGGITYRERTGTFEFLVTDKRNWAKTYSDILNYLHGKRMKVTLDDDSEFYYDARLSVNEWKSDEYNSTIVIEAVAYPFKKKQQETVITKVTGQGPFTIHNLKERVMPLIETSAQMQINFNDKTVVVEAGKHILDIVLEEGDNVFDVYGTGTITFTFREGCL